MFPSILKELAAPNVKVQEVQEWVFMDFLNFEDGGTISTTLTPLTLYCLLHKITEQTWILVHTQFFISYYYDYVEIGLH
jgi:hypothetical protein